MDKTITTALLIIISIVMALVLFNAAYPAIMRGGDAISNMTNRASDRMKSQIVIVHMAGELDSRGQWQDTNANSLFDVFLWVKNIGTSPITAIERMDVFFGREGNFVRIPYQGDAGGSYPYWVWQVENGAEWTPTATLKITIHYPSPLASGRYFAQVTVPNGVSDEQFLGL
jgi:hypothetical protein